MQLEKIQRVQRSIMRLHLNGNNTTPLKNKTITRMWRKPCPMSSWLLPWKWAKREKMLKIWLTTQTLKKWMALGKFQKLSPWIDNLMRPLGISILNLIRGSMGWDMCLHQSQKMSCNYSKSKSCTIWNINLIIWIQIRSMRWLKWWPKQ